MSGRVIRNRWIDWLFMAAAFGIGLTFACPPTPAPPPPQTACTSISIAPIENGTGSQTLCTTATDCREDTMATLISAAFCSDKSGGSCPQGNQGCSNKCVGVVKNTGLIASDCSWDRNSECKTAAGVDGKNCTCTWTIPPAAALSCGCDCS
jgi:hypothetical protein